jgi:hypothetical protein
MEWISVKEKTPENDRDVLVWIAGGCNFAAVSWYRNGVWNVVGDFSKRDDITHWMELPPKPDKV